MTLAAHYIGQLLHTEWYAFLSTREIADPHLNIVHFYWDGNLLIENRRTMKDPIHSEDLPKNWTCS